MGGTATGRRNEALAERAARLAALSPSAASGLRGLPAPASPERPRTLWTTGLSRIACSVRGKQPAVSRKPDPHPRRDGEVVLLRIREGPAHVVARFQEDRMGSQVESEPEPDVCGRSRVVLPECLGNLPR